MARCRFIPHSLVISVLVTAIVVARLLAYPTVARATSGALLPGEADRRGAGASAAGCSHSVVRRPDGLVATFGANASGQLGNATTASSSSPVLVVRSDGLPLQNVIAVAAGCDFSLALDADGTVWSWGENGDKQLGNDSTTDRSHADRVLVAASTPLTGATSISAGPTYGLAVTSSGFAVGWGHNVHGQLGRTATATRQGYALTMRMNGDNRATGGAANTCAAGDPVLPFVVGLSSGYYGPDSEFQTIILRANGEPYLTGASASGSNYRCPKFYDGGTAAPFTMGGSWDCHIKAVASGGDATGEWLQLALCTDGVIWARGSDGYDQIGNGTAGATTNFTRVLRASGTQLTGVIAVDAGARHGVALDANGDVWSWGEGTYGKNAQGTTTTQNYAIRARQNVGNTAWTALGVAAGSDHTVSIDAASNLRAWGRNAAGQLGNGTTTNSSYATSASTYTPPVAFVQSVAKSGNVQLLRSDGTVWTSGNDSYGNLGDGAGATPDSNRFVKLALGGALTRSLADGSATGHLLGALDEQGRPWAWGRNLWGGVGNNTSGAGGEAQNVFAPVLQSNATDGVGNPSQLGVQATTGENFSGYLRSDGHAYFTGGDTCRDGPGSQQTSILYRHMYADGTYDKNNLSSISAGRRHKVVRVGDGTVLACGFNDKGPIGNNTSTDQWRWQPTTGATQIRQATTGDLSSHLLSSAGTVWSVGRTFDNDLGHGVASAAPPNDRVLAITETRLAGPTSLDARAIASGSGATGAVIRSDGTLASWGLNAVGQRCNGGSSASIWATAVGGVGNLANLSVGTDFLTGVRANGQPFFCGTNTATANGTCGATGTALTPVVMGCAPATPTMRTQVAADGATNIPDGGGTQDGETTPVRLRFLVQDSEADEWLRPWVEVVPTAASFAATCGTYTTTTYAGPQVPAAAANTNVAAEVPVTGLTLGTTYKWRACVQDAYGKVSAWDPAAGFLTFTVSGSDITPPVPAPSGTGTAASPTQIDWAFSGSYSDPESGLPASPYTFTGNAPWGSSTTWSQGSLTANTQYSVQLKVRNAVGLETPSTSVNAWTHAGAPTPGVATLGWTTGDGYRTTLAWTAHANGSTGYRIYSDVTGYVVPLATPAGGATSATVAGLDPNTAYALRICPLNGAGIESTACADWASVRTPPAAPTITNVVVAPTSATFTFTTATGATSTRLRTYSDGACSTLVTTDAAVTSPFPRTALPIDMPRWYRADSYSTTSGAWGASSCTALPGNGRTTLSVTDPDDLDLGAVVAGTVQTDDIAVRVTTNASTGYTLAARALGPFTDGTHVLPPIASGTVGAPAGSDATLAPGPGIGMSVIAADHGLEPAWSTGGQRWARFESAPTVIHSTGSSAFTSGLRDTNTTVRVRVEPPAAQPPGAYSMQVEFIAVAIP